MRWTRGSFSDALGRLLLFDLLAGALGAGAVAGGCQSAGSIFFISAALAGLSFIWPLSRQFGRRRTWLAWLCALVLFAGPIIAYVLMLTYRIVPA